ncbi:MAG: heavy-metal-associated domain-containing protein [Bacteroidetes bacterium]|nr:heavy-metal-associated domain-containing protein [Bacteroidota bacterium]
MSKIAIIFFLAIFNTNLFAVEQKTSIKTSANCKMCKKTNEQTLLSIKGVKSAKLDLTNFKVKVVYDDAFIDVKGLEMAISKVGYDANNTKSDSTAYSELPACCKKGAFCGH